VPGKLAAVVKGDGVDVLGIRPQHLDNRIPNDIGLLASNSFHQIMTALTLCQRHQYPSSLFAKYRVRLPVAKPLPAIDNGRALLNRTCIFDGGAPATRAFAITLMALAQITIQLASLSFVGSHIAIYPLMAHP
jgi:hypothetical protein